MLVVDAWAGGSCMPDRSAHRDERRPAGARPSRTPAPRPDAPGSDPPRDRRAHHGTPTADDRATTGLRRRRVVAGLAGTGLGAAALHLARDRISGSGGAWSKIITPPPPASRPRPAAARAADAGGFGSRDESFASSVSLEGAAPPARPPAPASFFATAGEAARATKVTVPTILATDDPVVHLLRRATFGPTPALVDEVHTKGIDAWLAEQLDPTRIPDDDADAAWRLFPMASMTPGEIQAAIERHSWGAMVDYGRATVARQIWSRRQLFEVMVDFWADHLHVPLPGPGVWDVGGAYHADVIRRHALGSFTDMLLAAMRHPAMLRYLTNAESSKDSVNENLGRELLELHTVGVGSGYSETDVRNSAYILTGRTVATEDGPGPEGSFAYDAARHWTGPVEVLGFRDPNPTAGSGLDVGDAYLRYLASHPSTGQTIARKLAVRFVADNPPPELVDRLATAFLDAGTHIVPVLDLLVRSGAFWAAVGQKTRRPLENLVASARVYDLRLGPDTVEAIRAIYRRAQLAGHRPLGWTAPNGHPDVHAAWRSAGGLLGVWNGHRDLVQGLYKGATPRPADQLTARRPDTSVGEYIDDLCRRLCFQTFQPNHRNALIAFVGTDPATPAGQIDIGRLSAHLVPLVLDSPYFALR